MQLMILIVSIFSFIPITRQHNRLILYLQTYKNEMNDHCKTLNGKWKSFDFQNIAYIEKKNIENHAIIN